MTVALVTGWNIPVMGLKQAIDVGFARDLDVVSCLPYVYPIVATVLPIFCCLTNPLAGGLCVINDCRDVISCHTSVRCNGEIINLTPDVHHLSMHNTTI
jgi:hypothetical protein